MPTLNLTWYQLEALDLARCECGHRFNNHFEHGKRPCAHCECKSLKRWILPLPSRRRRPRISTATDRGIRTKLKPTVG